MRTQSRLGTGDYAAWVAASIHPRPPTGAKWAARMGSLSASMADAFRPIAERFRRIKGAATMFATISHPELERHEDTPGERLRGCAQRDGRVSELRYLEPNSRPALQ